MLSGVLLHVIAAARTINDAADHCILLNSDSALRKIHAVRDAAIG